MEENYGVIAPKIKKDDFVAGIFSDIPYEKRCDDWSPHLPSEETQYSTQADWMDCVSESYNSIVETQINWMIANKQFTDTQISEMKELHYFDDKGNPNFSDRFLAKMSGTTRQGNSQNAVAEAARKYGLVGEMDWTETPNMTWEDYYAEIPQHIKDKAKRIFDFINIGNKVNSKGQSVPRTGGFEWVITEPNPVTNYKTINQDLKLELKHAPIQITVPVCPSYKYKQTSPFQTCSLTAPAHALTLYRLKDTAGKLIRQIFDSYPPFRIEFDNNYPIPYGLKIIASAIKETHTITTDGGQIHTSETPAFWERFKSWLTKWGIPFVDKQGKSGSIMWYD